MIKSIFLIFQMLFASSGITDLNGRWQATKAEMAGAVWPDAVTKTILLTLNDGKYELGPDSGDVIIIDSQKMEVKGNNGPNKGKTYKAIYERKGDELTICYDLSGNSFPQSFETKPETKLFLVYYSRLKN